MNFTGKTLAGIVLFGLGAMILLGMLGIHIGGLFTFVIAGVLIYFGVKKLKTGHNVAGVILLVLGIMFLTGAVPFLFSTLVAIVCIYFGWRMIKRSGHEAEPVSAGPNHGYGPNHGKGYDTHDKMNFESDFDKEWNEFMKRNDKKDV